MKAAPGIQQSLPSLGRIVGRFWPKIRPHRWLLLLSGLMMLVEIGLKLLAPWPMKFIFDNVIMLAPGQPGLETAWLQLSPTALLTLLALAFFAIEGLRAAASYANQVGPALVGNRVLTDIRGDLYRHLQYLSLSFHTEAKSGDLLTRLITDIGRLQEVVVTAALPLVIHSLTLIGMLLLMLWLNWQLALVSLIAFPLFPLLLSRLTGRIRHVSREQRKREGAMAATAAESIGAIKVVQALSLEKILAKSFASTNQKSLKEGVKAKRLAAALERAVDLIVAAGTALVLWYGARLVLSGAITPGDLLVFVAYLKSAFRPMRDLAKYTGRLAKAAASGERVLDLLDLQPAIRNRPDAKIAPPFKGAVRLEHLSFAYRPGQPVLKYLNLAVEPGQQVALVGSSGSGKSTLASLLLRLYDPTGGRVTIDGTDIRRFTLESLRSQIGIVLQDSVLFGVSIRDNIAYGNIEASDEAIKAAARLANAHDFIEALPDGYDTILGERGATLSGGQRQRIAIARAAVRQAPIIILDEATTGLDGGNEQDVLQALARLTEGRTTFIITHDLPTIAQADQILYLEDGAVVEQGTHAELLRLGGRYANTYHAQAAQPQQSPSSSNGPLKETSYAFAR